MSNHKDKLGKMLVNIYNNAPGCKMCLMYYKKIYNKNKIESKDLVELCVELNCPVVEYATRYALLSENIEKILKEK